MTDAVEAVDGTELEPILSAPEKPLDCPKCKKLFSANEELKKILREKEQKYLEELKVKEKLLEEKFKLNFKLKEKRI